MPLLAFGETFGETCGTTLAGACVNLSVHRPDARTPPHCHANDYVCLVLDGGFAQQSASGCRDYAAGDASFHFAEDRHEDVFTAAGALCLNIHLPPGMARPARRFRRLDGGTRATASLLAAEIALGETADRLAAAALLAELLGAPEGSDEGGWVDRVVAALEGDPGRAWSLAELARLAGRHPTHLARAFRRRTGVSIGAFRRRRRLRALALRLRCGDAPLADLAAELGYADQAHMSREFSAFAGLSPAAWRRARR